MKSTIKYRMMLDSSRSGMGLGYEEAPEGMKVEIHGTEIRRIKKIMQAADALEAGTDTMIYVPPPEGGASGMNLVLRKDKDRPKYYLNLDGNPTTFFNENNDYGSPDTSQLVRAFRYVIRIVQDSTGIKFPRRIRESVRDGDIALNSLEFAIYTYPVRDPLGLIRAWKWVYTMPSMSDSGMPQTFTDMIRGVRYVHTEFWDEFRVWTQHRNSSPDRMFCAYYKAKEISEVQGRMPPEDLQGRIRIDLGLKYRWFADKKIKNLMDFDAYLKKKGGIREVLQFEIGRIMGACHLQYMFEIGFDESKWDLAKCSAQAHKHMVMARKEMSIPLSAKFGALQSGDMRAFERLYRDQQDVIVGDAQRLQLDMSRVQE